MGIKNRDGESQESLVVQKSVEDRKLAEYIPTLEEMKDIFERLLRGKKYKTERQINDDGGLYLWEVVTTGENGGKEEYLYTRKPLRPREDFVGGPYISVTFYDKGGKIIGGNSVAKFVDKKWKLTP